MLIVLLAIAAGGVPILENPGSSLLDAQKRFVHLVSLLKARGIRTLAIFMRLFIFSIYL